MIQLKSVHCDNLFIHKVTINDFRIIETYYYHLQPKSCLILKDFTLSFTSYEYKPFDPVKPLYSFPINTLGHSMLPTGTHLPKSAFIPFFTYLNLSFKMKHKF